MKAFFHTSVFLILCACGALAVIKPASLDAQEQSPVAARQDILEHWGKATKPVGGMLQGTVAFDLATVQNVLQLYTDGAATLPTLFPEPVAGKAEKTDAKAEIWQNKAKFVALFDAFGKSALEAKDKIVDEASFKAQMPGLLGQCKNCHDSYRAKKS